MSGVPTFIPQHLEMPGDPERGVIGLRASITTPEVLYWWRSHLFLTAARQAIGHAMAHGESAPNDTEANLITEGVWRATRRAMAFDPTEGVLVFSPPVQRLANLIGSKSFKEITNATPPRELIDFIISEENRDRLRHTLSRPSLDEITIEVLRGRLEWEDRFAEAGVPDPQTFTPKIDASQRFFFHEDGSPARNAY